MSLSDKVSYLLDSIMLLSLIIAIMISTVKFERNNLPFTIAGIFKGEFNLNMYGITPLCYVINICILRRLYLTDYGFLKEELIWYTYANFDYATTFGFRNIAFQIWWLPREPHRSECIFAENDIYGAVRVCSSFWGDVYITRQIHFSSDKW